MSGILSRGQWRLHATIGVFYAVVVATALYLAVRAPAADTFPRPFQVVLLSHLGLGTLVIIVGVAFVVWHLAPALRTRHGTAIATGLGLTALASLLLVTGLGLLVGGAADRAYVARVAHGAAALLIPLF